MLRFVNLLDLSSFAVKACKDLLDQTMCATEKLMMVNIAFGMVWFLT